jgi:NAD(P)-dependent dehydrogenase (short-subunit alcohol dehydrogenase family)
VLDSRAFCKLALYGEGAPSAGIFDWKFIAGPVILIDRNEAKSMSTISRQDKRTVAITGAGGGLGRETALAFAAKGYRVFGTALKPEEITDLKAASSGAASLTLCDITDEGAVAAWAREVEGQSNGGLDLLIQNAGILTPGPLEVLNLDAIKREYNVNTFAPIAVTNAFLPALRKQRGRIVFVSTMTATLALPFNGPSGSSKAALEVLATIYRAELKPFGVDVVIAAPGNMRTGGPAATAAALKKVSDNFTDAQRQLYGRSFGTFADKLNAMQGGGMSAADAAARVIAIAEEMPAPIKSAVGDDAEEVLRFVHGTSPATQDIRRLEMVGLGPDGEPA